MKDLFGNEYKVHPKEHKNRKRDGNPLIPVYGKGPEGKRCKHCSHLYRKVYAKTYYKCGLRKDTNGTGTDHRVNWWACGMFALDGQDEFVKPNNQEE